MDEVILQLRLAGVDFVILYQLARRDRLSVEEWVRKTILEKVEREQMQALQQQQQPTQEKKGGE